MRSETFFREGWDEKRLAAEIELWDATTASHMARCARYGQHAICDGLRGKGEAYQLNAGKAVHAALAAHYSGSSEDECMAILAAEWGYDREFRPPAGKYTHLHLGHLEVVFKNYLDYARVRDTFKPLLMHRDELDFSRVLAAYYNVTDDGVVVLGEAKFIMEFDLTLPHGEQIVLHYSGRPDLPVAMGGGTYMMDHKTSSSFLSSWWGEQHQHSNQLRGYCAMLESLTHLRLDGGMINGVYVGAKAALHDFKGSRFERYGPFPWTPGHYEEALLNQYFWKQELFRCFEQGYFPQNTGKSCQSCNFSALCQVGPNGRTMAAETDFVRSDDTPMDHFLGL